MSELLNELAERMDDFNGRMKSILTNDRLSTESKNLAIGLLVTLRMPEFRKIPGALRAAQSNEGGK